MLGPFSPTTALKFFQHPQLISTALKGDTQFNRQFFSSIAAGKYSSPTIQRYRPGCTLVIHAGLALHPDSILPQRRYAVDYVSEQIFGQTAPRMRMGYFSFERSRGFTLGGQSSHSCTTHTCTHPSDFSAPHLSFDATVFLGIGLGGSKTLGRSPEMSGGDFAATLSVKLSCSEILQADTSKSLKSGLYPIGVLHCQPLLAYSHLPRSSCCRSRRSWSWTRTVHGALRHDDRGR
jgi:hypothetical protein